MGAQQSPCLVIAGQQGSDKHDNWRHRTPDRRNWLLLLPAANFLKPDHITARARLVQSHISQRPKSQHVTRHRQNRQVLSPATAVCYILIVKAGRRFYLRA